MNVLVVGGGAAGLTAALAAAREGANVTVLSKTHPFRSHSTQPVGGVNLALGEGDSWEAHLRDVLNDGHFLSDQDTAEILCREGPEIFSREFGSLFAKNGEAFRVLHETSLVGTPRLCIMGDGLANLVGLSLTRHLYQQACEAAIRLLPDRFLLSVLRGPAGVAGVAAWNLYTGDVEIHPASAVVLAGGGLGDLFLHNSNSPSATGDVLAAAYREGVPLCDMEFQRMHHLILYGTSYAITEGAFGKGLYLLNAKGERFLQRYAPDTMENTSTYYLKRYIQMEIDAGGGIENSFLLADFTHLGEAGVQREVPRTRLGCLQARGLDIAYDHIPVVPGHFNTIGGIAVDANGRTSLPGLFAAGECAGAGVHGADWRVGNSLLEAVVFGKRTGCSAALHANKNRDISLPQGVEKSEKSRLQSLLEQDGKERVHLLRHDLKKAMTRGAGVIRTGRKMEDSLARIQSIQQATRGLKIEDKGKEGNFELLSALELQNLLDLAEVIVSAALARAESRGAHYRSDYPERNDSEWLKHSVVERTDGKSKVRYRPVNITRYAPGVTTIR